MQKNMEENMMKSFDELIGSASKEIKKGIAPQPNSGSRSIPLVP